MVGTGGGVVVVVGPVVVVVVVVVVEGAALTQYASARTKLVQSVLSSGFREKNSAAVSPNWVSTDEQPSPETIVYHFAQPCAKRFRKYGGA